MSAATDAAPRPTVPGTPDRSTTVSVLTAVTTADVSLLPDMAASVGRLRHGLRHTPVNVEWVVMFDGVAPTPVDADVTVGGSGRVGQGPALRQALRAATGAAVMVLTPDAVFAASSPSALVVAVNTLAAYNCCSWVGFTVVGVDGAPARHSARSPVHVPCGGLARHVTLPLAMCPSAVVVDRRLASRVGGWPAQRPQLRFVRAVSAQGCGRLFPHPLTRRSPARP